MSKRLTRRPNDYGLTHPAEMLRRRTARRTWVADNPHQLHERRNVLRAILKKPLLRYPIDRYPPGLLRAIRRMPRNFKGELRR